MDEQAEGGAAWELEQAAEQLAEAVSAGDSELARTAMMRHSQALVTQSYATLVPTLERVFQVVVKTEIKQLADDLRESSRLADDRYRYLTDRLSFFLKTEDKRHDNANAELNKIYAALAEVQEDIHTRRAYVTERLDHIDAELAVVEQPCRACPFTIERERER